MSPNTFPITPTLQLGQLVWHKANRERRGIIEAVVIYSRTAHKYMVSWGDGEWSIESETVITGEPPEPDFVGAGADN
jgi:hypothetical protein